ncbi:alpha/beta fold hydrolase [Mycobacterium helveticum]|uniref:Alpha/beta fold hydrolase n=1 Tax=Mycobacterium helveticum TaxID=2592811 RepID=A0A557XRA9_9MYCO|nr:alpha/beta fold hydrolase [Mycobacterium helveticum]TVS85078.1 alpha/beta fold hydrolase [Mycobacterium helveticum]TVS88451.1 alpha/beta fold hydrolase [Mycobacterium helveticum]
MDLKTISVTDGSVTTSRVNVGGGLHLQVHEAGQGEAVLLLHGGGPGASGWSNFSQNVESLAAHYRVLVIDQPGYGGSDRPTITGDYWKYTAGALIGLLDMLGIERTHLIGNSLGGGTSLRLALDFPERVNKLILMGPAGGSTTIFSPDPSEGVKAMAGFYAVAEPDEQRMDNLLRTMIFNPDLLSPETIRERWESAVSQGAREAVLQTLRSVATSPDAQLWRLLDNVNQPCLLIWGRDDRVLPLEGAIFALKRMPNADLHVFGRTGHWAQLERKDEFNRIALDFLNH